MLSIISAQTGLDAEHWGMNSTAVNEDMETSRVLEYVDHDHDHDARGRAGHVFVGSTSYTVQYSTGRVTVTVFIFILQQGADITRRTK